MTVSHLDLNNWLLTDRETAVEAFSNQHIRIGFEEGESGAWLAMKHRDSGFALRRFVDTPEDARAAFDEAADMMPAYLATVERVNQAYPATRQVPFTDTQGIRGVAVHCGDWAIDRLSAELPYSHWSNESAPGKIGDYDLEFRGSALGVLNRACVYQEFLNSVQHKETILEYLKNSTSAFAQGVEVRGYRLASAEKDFQVPTGPDYDAPDPYARYAVENKLFFSVEYQEDCKEVTVFAMAMKFDGNGQAYHSQVDAGAEATIQGDGQIVLLNREPGDYMHWSFTGQELGLDGGNLSIMQFAGVSAFDTLTSNHAYQASASEDYLTSIDGDVFTLEEPSYGRDSGMGL